VGLIRAEKKGIIKKKRINGLEMAAEPKNPSPARGRIFWLPSGGTEKN